VSDPAGTVPGVRRWVADPLLALAVVLLAAGVLAVWSSTGGRPGWAVPALLGVVAAGLALSGST